jgi:hypothetical protein
MRQSILAVLALATAVGLLGSQASAPRKSGLNASGDQNQSTIHADSTQISKIFESSKKLQQVLSEAEAGTQFRITFAKIPTRGELAQGYTSFNEDSDRNGITVHVMLDPQDELVEDRLAHELFHIILRKEGFPTEFRILTTPAAIGEYPWQMVTDAVQTLESCYADARIDVLMTQRNFSPKLLNRRQADYTIGEGSEAPFQPARFLLDWRKNIALANYCLSIRERDFDMEDIFKAWRHVNPMVEADESALEKEVGTKPCEDARSCIESTKKLRKAAGYDAEVQFFNPLTHQFE